MERDNDYEDQSIAGEIPEQRKSLEACKRRATIGPDTISLRDLNALDKKLSIDLSLRLNDKLACPLFLITRNELLLCQMRAGNDSRAWRLVSGVMF